jgi:bacterioferritin-associated ferredoxin
MSHGKKHATGTDGSSVVCPCKHVTEADVQAAVASGATTLKDVRRMTGATSKCGHCKSQVKACLRQALAERDATAVAPSPSAGLAPAAVPAPTQELRIHGVYRHFKGDFYLVEDVARHSETGEEYVVYRKLYGDGSLWVRPKDMFLSPVDRQKHPEATQEFRFQLQDIPSIAGH